VAAPLDTFAASVALIDFILNVAAVLLWVNWRSLHFDPLARSTPASLVWTLKPTEKKKLKGWPIWTSLVLLLIVRAVVYWAIGSPADWTPKLDLGLVVPAFRSDQFLPLLLYSWLSFLRLIIIFYFWLLFLAAINRNSAETDPIQRLIRLHLGAVARWPWFVQLLLPVILVAALWMALHQVLVYMHITYKASSTLHLAAQGLLLGAWLFMSLKYVLPVFLFLHFITSYVYLGMNPLWDFSSTTSRNVLRPIRWLPLRFGKLDLTPLAGVALIFLLMDWAPRFILTKLDQRNLTIWPQ